MAFTEDSVLREFEEYLKLPGYLTYRIIQIKTFDTVFRISYQSPNNKVKMSPDWDVGFHITKEFLGRILNLVGLKSPICTLLTKAGLKNIREEKRDV